MSIREYIQSNSGILVKDYQKTFLQNNLIQLFTTNFEIAPVSIWLKI